MTERAKDSLSESTVARIAGNLLSGYRGFFVVNSDECPHRSVVVANAVKMAREIVEEVRKTRPNTEGAAK